MNAKEKLENPIKFHFEKIAYFFLTLCILWSSAGDLNTFWKRQIGLVLTSALLGAFYFLLHRDYTFLTEKKINAAKGLLIGGGSALVSIFILHISPVPTHLLSEFNFQNPLGIFLFLFLSIPLWELFSRKIFTPLWGAASVAFLDAVLFGIGTQNIAVFIFTFLTCWGAAFTFLRFGFSAAVISRVFATAIVLWFLSH